MTQTLPSLPSRSSSDMALSPTHFSFAFFIGIIWLLGTSIVSILPTKLSVPLSTLLGLACLQILVGGIGYLVKLELASPKKLSFVDAFAQVRSFIIKRWPSLLAAPWLMGTALLSLMAVVFGVTQIVTRIPGIGGFIGSLLLVPMFCFLLALVAVSLNTYLLPCVVGIEGCNALDAMKRLLHTVRENPIQLMGGYLKIVLGFLPTVLGSLIVTVMGLTLSLLLCKSGQAMDALTLFSNMGGSSPLGSSSPGLNWGWLDNLSVGFILFAWAAYIVTSVTSSFAVLYYKASPRISETPKS